MYESHFKLTTDMNNKELKYRKFAQDMDVLR